MNVLLDCSHVTTGGGLQAALAVLEGAARTPGHEWHAVLSAEVARELPPERDRDLARVERLRAVPGAAARFRQIARVLPALERRVAPDVVFTVFGPSKWRPRAPQLVGFAISHVLYPDYDPFARASGPREWLDACRIRLSLRWVRRAVVRADYLVVETEIIRRRLGEILGYPPARTFVVRNSFSPAFAASLDRHEPGAAGGPFRLLVPSAYYPHKNLAFVPKVARALEAFSPPDFEFVLTLPPEGAGWRRIAREAESLGVGGRVRTVGAVPHAQLGRRYRDSDAVFLPTLLECSTAVYPESFAAGVPLLTSDLDFARELCGDGAAYFDPASPEAAARAIHRLLSSPAQRETLVEGGRRALRENYPSPAQKWDDQLACLRAVAERGRPV